MKSKGSPQNWFCRLRRAAHWETQIRPKVGDDDDDCSYDNYYCIRAVKAQYYVNQPCMRGPGHDRPSAALPEIRGFALGLDLRLGV